MSEKRKVFKERGVRVVWARRGANIMSRRLRRRGAQLGEYNVRKIRRKGGIEMSGNKRPIKLVTQRGCCEMSGKLFVSAVLIVVAVAATANASAQDTYLFHRHYWHGIPDGGGMRDYVDAVGLDAGLTAVWDVAYPGSSCVPWLVKIGEDRYIENQKAIEVNQSTNKGCIMKIAKTNWGYVVIAGDHLVGLDNNFNVLWCKEPKNHFDGGHVILSVGDSVVIGSADSWPLDIWTSAHGAVFMSIDQSGKITGKETIHWWDGGFSDMIRDSSGNYVALGTGGDYCSNSRIVKLDSNLHTQWIIGGFGGIPDISFERVNYIVENSNGVYIAAGEGTYGWEGWQRKPWIMAIDKDGNVLWAKTYDSLNYLAFGDVVATQDGGLLFLVVGASDGPALLKTDAEGNPQWCKYYKNDVGYAKIVPADDGYYIVGSKWGRVDEVFGINRSEWLWYGSIFKVDLEGNIPSDAYEVEEWQVEPPQTWNNVTYENIEISHFSPEEWDPTFVDGDMPVTLQNEPKVATVFEYIPNKPPVANFTYSPERPIANQTITFDASSSYDPDGTIVSYEWDFGDGSEETTTSPTIQHSYSIAGTYTVTLTVTDNDGLTNSTSTQVEVTSAEIGEIRDDFSTDTGLWTYIGSAYRDEEHEYVVLTENINDQVGVIWLKRNVTSPFTAEFKYKAGGGSGADGIVFMFYKQKNYEPGKGGYLGFNDAGGGEVPGYGIEFDNHYYFNSWDPQTSHIALIKDSVESHLIYVSDSRTGDNEWHDVKVEVSESTINVYIDGELLFTWNGTIDRTYGGIGFSAATGILNNWHIIDDVRLTLETYVNKPPVANFTYSPENPVVGQAVTFDASGSYDPDGSIVSYEWDFGDGNVTNTTEETINHSYSESGSYKVTLTVKDDKGATNSTTKMITIYSPTAIFDTGSSRNPYPSIMGVHKGTIKPNHTVIATKLYTYACEGTGGHTEYARIWNATWEATATWEGYAGDWHNISFDKTVVLLAGETYFYEIRTGSYPQIHHTDALLTANGWINCTEFTDANGKVYYDWIPAIKLF